MKKCVELELSRSHVVLTETWQSFELAGLLRNRDVQAQFCHVIGSRGLRIMVNSDICQANRVQWLGLTITHWEPDPLIYLPFIDYVLGQGIQIRSVSMAGIDPFYRWIRWADAVVVAMCLAGIGVGGWIHRQTILSRGIAQRALIKRDQAELNRLHIRNANSAMIGRLKRGVDWVRTREGVVLRLEVGSRNASVASVCHVDAFGTATDSADVDMNPIADGWVSVYASKLD